MSVLTSRGSQDSYACCIEHNCRMKIWVGLFGQFMTMHASSMNLTKDMHTFTSHLHHLIWTDILTAHTLSVNTSLDLPETTKTAGTAWCIESDYIMWMLTCQELDYISGRLVNMTSHASSSGRQESETIQEFKEMFYYSHKAHFGPACNNIGLS